jgi:(p)ppGpp synthase/HD superfamily hydrolase
VNNIIDKAKEFALRVHSNQRHGCLSMEDHLTAVTDKIREEYAVSKKDECVFSFDAAIAVGWLHDTIEDTSVTYEDIRDTFGFDIAEFVDAVTDGKGSTRTERHLNTYYRTRRYNTSIFVKMADRWHNHSRTIANKEVRFAKDYASEYLYFKFALYNDRYHSFWKQLDEQYEQLLAIVNE